MEHDVALLRGDGPAHPLPVVLGGESAHALPVVIHGVIERRLGRKGAEGHRQRNGQKQYFSHKIKISQAMHLLNA